MHWDKMFDIEVFAGRNQVELAERICQHLDMPFGQARTDVFPDGELIVHTEEDVRGRDCFVVLSTSTPVNDNVMELLIFADSLRRASARRITAVVPYYGYARQDRKESGRTPITAKLIANLITEAGYDRVLTIDLHAAQIQGFFDIPVDHLSSGRLFVDYFQNGGQQASVFESAGTQNGEHRRGKPLSDDLVVVSPDIGNVKMANMYADALGAGLAIIDKRRLSGERVRTQHIIGDVAGRDVLMVDDMISTGGTVCEAASLVRKHGAKDITVAATHAVFAGEAVRKLGESDISRIVVTNTIPIGDRLAPLNDRLEVLCISKLFADAIFHIHHNQSVSALFKGFGQSKR